MKQLISRSRGYPASAYSLKTAYIFYISSLFSVYQTQKTEVLISKAAYKQKQMHPKAKASKQNNLTHTLNPKPSQHFYIIKASLFERMPRHPKHKLKPMLYFLFFVPLFTSVFVFLKLKQTQLKQQRQNDLLELNLFLLRTLRQSRRHVYGGDDDDSNLDNTRGPHKGSVLESIEQVRRKKKRGKKKKHEDVSEVKGADVVCLYPFTSSTSATQRKIKKQYHQLFKCNASNKLTLSQVGQFVTCLVKARHELQHKADAIQRKFTITKALLNKADRSSLERLRKQICKLEFEQKRLEEDTSVYNWLQHQVKLSPAYKKMLEIACTELKNISREQMKSEDEEFTEISFEDFLAQEKKDSFWQKNMKSRSCTS